MRRRRNAHLLAASLALSGCPAGVQDPTGKGEPPVQDLATQGPFDIGPRPDIAHRPPGDGNEEDRSGPTVSNLTPAAGAFIGGVIAIHAEIEDPSGVDDATVMVVFAGDPNLSVPLQRPRPADKVFTGAFDTARLPSDLVHPVLSLRASDLRGNTTEVGEELILDTVAPGLSLDPPDLHAFQDKMGTWICSHPFDPVGADAAGDGEVVGQLITLRARIEDFGNRASGQAVMWVSFVDDTSVKLYVAPQSFGEIVKDTDGDTLCDAINPALVPDPMLQGEKGKAVEVSLAPIPVAGVPDFTSGDADLVCLTVGSPDNKMAPMPVCRGFPSTYFKGYSWDGKQPSIWSVPPIGAPPAPNCGGIQFDAGNKIPDGPLCAAVVAVDHVGNRNVSAPLRLCLDRGTGLCAAYNPNSKPCASCKPGVRFNTWKAGDPPAVPFPPGEKYYMP